MDIFKFFDWSKYCLRVDGVCRQEEGDAADDVAANDDDDVGSKGDGLLDGISRRWLARYMVTGPSYR